MIFLSIKTSYICAFSVTLYFSLTIILLPSVGVPTSRAGSLIVSDDTVRRDMFYNGNFKNERTAVVMRLAR